eukprot:CAMPEP_0179486938 /NCGR_PEP_ID=MMETSP0799-20121207/63090_1 /TAXON_ID=46947 /ORGANISM="Geminigera cryophila, Strain CCMP2564" /LENGTH=126 /DNA_ID=CAMNT_0021301893 /DNA_START=295 /DNA_END=675 /DNA_ORIENTATION=-
MTQCQRVAFLVGKEADDIRRAVYRVLKSIHLCCKGDYVCVPGSLALAFHGCRHRTSRWQVVSVEENVVLTQVAYPVGLTFADAATVAAAMCAALGARLHAVVYGAPQVLVCPRLHSSIYSAIDIDD